HPVGLVAVVDDRADEYLYPPPTHRRLRERLRLSVCGRRAGLHASLTRLVQFGASGADDREREAALQRIEARLIGRTRPGVGVECLLQAAAEEFGAAGFEPFADRFAADPGGPTGYRSWSG